MDRVLSHRTQSIHAVQRGHLKDCTSHLRCAAGVRPGVDPLHILHGWSRCHHQSGLQSAPVCRRPTNIWIDGTERCCWSDGSYGADVRPVECVWDLGVLIDSNMTISNHVNNVAGICFFQLRQLRIIRRSLTTDAAHSLVRALIHTRVDYCNGLLAAGPKYLLEKLQSVLRAAARLVLQFPYCCVRFWHYATAAALARDARSRQVQTVYAGIQMPARTRSSLSVRSLHTRHGTRSAEIICDTWTIAVYPPDWNENVGSARILLWFVRSLECTPSASALPCSFVEQFRN